MIKFCEKRVKTVSKGGINRVLLSKRDGRPVMKVLRVEVEATFRDGQNPIVMTQVLYKEMRNGKVRKNAATERSCDMDLYVAGIVDEILDELQDQEVRDAVELTRKREAEEF